MNSTKVPISLLVPCKNEEKNIQRCLRSVNWVDEAFVVDSQSTDRTISIAEQESAQVVQFNYRGVGQKRKTGLSTTCLSKTSGFSSSMQTNACLPKRKRKYGRSLRTRIRLIPVIGSTAGLLHGQTAQACLLSQLEPSSLQASTRKIRKDHGGDTDSGDHEIHEHVVVEGTTGKLKAIMDHHAFPTIESFVEKHNRYSNWEAVVESTSQDKAGSLQHKGVKGKRFLRRVFRTLPFRPTLRFLYVYLWQGGFLDGWPGYVFARLHGQYEFLTVIKARERSTGREKSR